MPIEIWFGLMFVITGSLALWGMLSQHPRIPSWVHRHDKVMHFVAFAILAGLAQGAWPNIAPLQLWTALAVFGLVAEGLQPLLSSRQFCWKDAIANAIGAATVLGLLHWQA